MTTFAPLQDRERRLAEIDAAVRSAWAEYRDGLQGLESREYDDQEAASWDQLQARLRELEGERAQVAGA